MAETYVAIFEEAFRDKGAVHAYLASSLDFPDWYGNNLDALLDCLTDISRPTHIAFIRMRDEGPLARWFDKLALVLMIAARDLRVAFCQRDRLFDRFSVKGTGCLTGFLSGFLHLPFASSN